MIFRSVLVRHRGGAQTLEVFVSGLQAFIFAILTASYIGGAPRGALDKEQHVGIARSDNGGRRHGPGDHRQGSRHRARGDRARGRARGADRACRGGHGAPARIRRPGASDDVHRHRVDRGPALFGIAFSFIIQGGADVLAAIFRFPRRPSPSRSTMVKDLYPHWEEPSSARSRSPSCSSSSGSGCCASVSALLEERRDKIQGDLERAEQTRTQAEQELAEYREQLAKARQESNGIIEEARTTAERLRAEIQARAEREAAATVAKAQDEIRAERDRLPGAPGRDRRDRGRARGSRRRSLIDATAHQRLIDEYIDQVSNGVAPNGKY